MIVVKNKLGQIRYSENEIIIFIEEQLKMIPGLVKLGNKNKLSFLRNTLSLRSEGVKIHQINENELLIELSIVLAKGIVYSNIEKEIKQMLKYSLLKKYGLEVMNIDIYIYDLI